MALTVAGDTANNLPKIRGLFTNKGTADLGDVAMLLREEEGYDVRDGGTSFRDDQERRSR